MKAFGILLLALLAAGALLVAISPVDSVAWQPPPAPALAGTTAPNERLREAELLALGQLTGPEDVDVDAGGRIYAGTADGRIVRIGLDGSLETFARTDGRPLGLEFDAAGNLIVADAWKGLLSVDPQGKVSVLATAAAGLPFAFTDDVDIAADGTIYFSDASSRFRQPDYELDLLETRPWGRLLAYRPDTGEVSVLLDGLYFANGVAVSADGNYVLVNETWRYRVLRYWLKGPQAGTHEVFADNLPGFPDGISRGSDGLFWVALPSPRKADLDLLNRAPLLKELVASLPQALRPGAVRYGLVLALDESGAIVHSLHDTTGTHLREITSVEEAGGQLYFGSLSNDRIGRLSLGVIFSSAM